MISGYIWYKFKPIPIMLRVKFLLVNDSVGPELRSFSFFTDLPARPMKGDTFMFNETIQGLEDLGEARLEYIHSHEFGVQAQAWHFDEKGVFLEVMLETVL